MTRAVALLSCLQKRTDLVAKRACLDLQSTFEVVSSVSSGTSENKRLLILTLIHHTDRYRPVIYTYTLSRARSRYQGILLYELL